MLQHFPEEGPTEKFPDPLPAGSSASLNHCTPIRPPPKRRCISEPPKKKRRILTEIVRQVLWYRNDKFIVASGIDGCYKFVISY